LYGTKESVATVPGRNAAVALDARVERRRASVAQYIASMAAALPAQTAMIFMIVFCKNLARGSIAVPMIDTIMF
jgi:hypothetical protein